LILMEIKLGNQGVHIEHISRKKSETVVLKVEIIQLHSRLDDGRMENSNAIISKTNGSQRACFLEDVQRKFLEAVVRKSKEIEGCLSNEQVTGKRLKIVELHVKSDEH